MSETKPERGEDGKTPARTVATMTGASRRDPMTGEYEALRPKRAGALARKRPSPLLDGPPTTWARGIVRAVGRVNHLDGKSRKPLHGPPLHPGRNPA